MSVVSASISSSTCGSTRRNAATTSGSNCWPRWMGDLGHRVLDAPGVLVGPRVGERVEHVGDRDDPPDERDLHAASRRVAVAVPALVVRSARSPRPLLRSGKSRPASMLAPTSRALSCVLELRECQPAGLEQDAVRNPILPTSCSGAACRSRRVGSRACPTPRRSAPRAPTRRVCCPVSSSRYSAAVASRWMICS